LFNSTNLPHNDLISQRLYKKKNEIVQTECFCNALKKNGFPMKEKTKFRFDVSAFQDPPFVAALLPTQWPLQHDCNENRAFSIYSAKHWTPKSRQN
jgi:hypothetical protein